MLITDLDPTSRRIVGLVLRNGPISRVGISRATGLSSGSLTRLTAPLIAAEILVEGDPEKTEVGRPQRPLQVADAAGLFAGVKIIKGELHAVLTGLTGQIHATAIRAVDTTQPEATVDAIVELVRQVVTGAELTAVGVALGAAVDPAGSIHSANLLGWGEVALTSLLTQGIVLPCYAANDVGALTLAEHWFGHGRGADDFAVVTIGAGVGAGAVVADELLVGHQGTAALLGAAWARDGRPFCEVLSTDALLRAGSEAAGRPLTPAELPTEPAAATVLDSAAGTLGELVALATLAWGPERILLTGDGIGVLAGRLELVREATAGRLVPDLPQPELVLQELDFLAWAQGAAAMAIQRCLTAG